MKDLKRNDLLKSKEKKLRKQGKNKQKKNNEKRIEVIYGKYSFIINSVSTVYNQ